MKRVNIDAVRRGTRGMFWTDDETVNEMCDELEHLRAWAAHRIAWTGSCCPCDDPDCPGDEP